MYWADEVSHCCDFARYDVETGALFDAWICEYVKFQIADDILIGCGCWDCEVNCCVDDCLDEH